MFLLSPFSFFVFRFLFPSRIELCLFLLLSFSLSLSLYIYIYIYINEGPSLQSLCRNRSFGWGCWIHQVQLCIAVRRPHRCKKATCLPCVVTRNAWGRDPGDWATLATEWLSKLQYFGPNWPRRAVEEARSDYLSDLVIPKHLIWLSQSLLWQTNTQSYFVL